MGSASVEPDNARIRLRATELRYEAGEPGVLPKPVAKVLLELVAHLSLRIRVIALGIRRQMHTTPWGLG